MTKDQVNLTAAGALGFLFLFSLALYFLVPGALTRVVLQFPREIGHDLTAEVRSLPFRGDAEKDSELLVKEILLGPARHDHLRLFSRESTVNQVLARGQTLYVDLNPDVLLPDPDAVFSLAKSLKVLDKTLLDNLKEFSKVVFTIKGQPLLDKFR